MEIRLAEIRDAETVRTIAHTTIREIYPHYYPKGAVDFFLAHHSIETIEKDIYDRCVYLLTDNGLVVGTVSIRDNEIIRLFVMPDNQGKGYGRTLMDLAESKISEKYNEIIIDASLSAKGIYLKRGYKECGYYKIKTDNNDYLCYDVMKKSI